MKKIIKIAVDGPAGAGKSSVSKLIAKKLNLEYIDSGAIYRAITKNILDSNLKIDDYMKINELLDNIDINLENGRIYLNSKDYTDYLRTKEVTMLVSPVSAIINVRKKVNKFLNKYALKRSVIMDGRDIGTVVFPDANFKFYLDASIDARAKRRFEEKNMDASLEEIKEAIIRRDDNDKNKEFGALKIADDAVYIDTTNLSIDKVVDKIVKKINNSKG